MHKNCSYYCFCAFENFIVLHSKISLFWQKKFENFISKISCFTFTCVYKFKSLQSYSLQLTAYGLQFAAYNSLSTASISKSDQKFADKSFWFLITKSLVFSNRKVRLYPSSQDWKSSSPDSRFQIVIFVDLLIAL